MVIPMAVAAATLTAAAMAAAVVAMAVVVVTVVVVEATVVTAVVTACPTLARAWRPRIGVSSTRACLFLTAGY